ncbi:SpoIIIAC/SpoIIIAD family protein [Cuneatibacter caecimuris]|uniref:Stage III sporulation protein AD n=1 Tax=Cuneatibacter caecimuris TaxID=1796618 RepID=A0A4Q7PP04_9FIRM|nr:SpoIIIAC/SpoIIIAD family protein [Cuneatibacter caecimuris]RZT00852.1 stage III sporulation protein AD [Cuneatibacter caecimuris]
MVLIGLFGILAVLLAVQLKGMKPEYGIYLSLAAAVVIFAVGAQKLEGVIEVLSRLQQYLPVSAEYLQVLLKMVGITYLSEFAAGICKDAGYQAIGCQIEMFGKLMILALSMPIVMALMETLDTFLR